MAPETEILGNGDDENVGRALGQTVPFSNILPASGIHPSTTCCSCVCECEPFWAPRLLFLHQLPLKLRMLKPRGFHVSGFHLLMTSGYLPIPVLRS
jgi:hypothetical protein